MLYAMPSTAQRVAFETSAYSREGDTLIDESASARIDAAIGIVTGWEPAGYFVDVDGKAISTNPASPDYREDWRDLLKETASDILDVVGRIVFQGTVSDRDASEMKVQRRVAATGLPPSQKS